MSAVNFTKAAAERIIAATKKVERDPKNLVGERNRTAPADISFWAWLSTPAGTSGLFWSWIKVQPVANLPTSTDPFTLDDPPLFELTDPPVAGYQNARPASNNRNVPPESIVMLHFIGYGTDGEPQYVFQWHSWRDESELPIHDHRDNRARSGGYAFSVFHPGTDLPQQDWNP